MKFLFVSQVPDTRLMGVPRVLYSIGDELEKRGHTVHYFYEDDGPKPLLKQMALMDWALRAAPRIAARCRKEQYDAVVITTLSGWALSTFRKWLLPPNTRVVSWHHGWEEMLWEQLLIEEKTGGHHFSTRFKCYYGKVILWAIRQSLRTQNAAIFTSTEECDWVKAQHPAQSHKVYYQPNGVSARYYFPQRTEQPSQGFPQLLFVGYWDPWRKGRKYMVEAFTQLRARYPEMRMTLAGTKLGAEQILPEFPEAVRAGLTVIPDINETDLIGLYHSHDIFVLPSLFEGMPLVVLEAMAAAIPVVTTGNNGMRDLIGDHINGLLIPRRDTQALVNAVSELVESPDLRNKLGFSAYHTVSSRFTWAKVTDCFEANMAHILSRPL